MADKPSLRKKIENFSYGLDNRVSAQNKTQIFQGQNDQNDEIVAIKVYNLRIPDGKALMKAAESEYEAMRKLKHPNIILNYDIFSTVNNCYVVFEFCEGGDLESYIKKKGKVPLEEAKVILKDILRGMDFIVNFGYLHCDIKPSNILIKDNTVKLSDFACCRRTNRPKDDSCEINMNRKFNPYRSPEVLRGGQPTQNSQVWSIMLIFYEMLTGRLPWHLGNQAAHNCELITKNPRAPLPLEIPIEVLELFERGLAVNPEKRMNIKELMNHPFIQSIFVEEDRQITKNAFNEVFCGHSAEIKLSAATRTEKQLCCQINWMRFIYRISLMIEKQESLTQPNLLYFIILKQLFVQLHCLKESINNRNNPYDFYNWEKFCNQSAKFEEFKKSIEDYSVRYEKQWNIYKTMLKNLRKGGKCSNILDQNLQLSEGLCLIAVQLSVQEIKRMWERIRNQHNNGKDEKVIELAKILDFIISYYQMNCILIEDFKRIDYFERMSKLDIILNTQPIEFDMMGVDLLKQKLFDLDLLN